MASKYVILYNVRDARDDKEYSVAKVSERNARFFVPIDDSEE